MKKKNALDVTETCYQLINFDVIVINGYPGSGKTGSCQLIGSILGVLDHRRPSVVCDLDSHGYRTDEDGWVIDLPMISKNISAILGSGCRLILGGCASNFPDFVNHLQRQFKVAIVWLDVNPENLRKVYDLRRNVRTLGSWVEHLNRMSKAELRRQFRESRAWVLKNYSNVFRLDVSDVRFPNEHGMSLWYDTVFYSNSVGELCDYGMFVSHSGIEQQRKFYGAFNLVIVPNVPRATIELISRGTKYLKARNSGSASSSKRATPPMEQERSVSSHGTSDKRRYSWRSRMIKVSSGWRDDSRNSNVVISTREFKRARDLWKHYHMSPRSDHSTWRDPDTVG